MKRLDFFMSTVAPGQVAHNVPADSFFRNGMSYHLVSEFAQNSCDAHRAQIGLGPAKLRITRKLLNRTPMIPFGIETIERHAKACEGEMGRFEISDKVEVLLVEDVSGGLTGEVTAMSNAPGTALGRYLFEKGTGIHGKTGRSGGRFGIGSTVGTFISEVAAMFLHALRQDGTSVASARFSPPTHELDGMQYAGDSRLGYLDENGNWQGIPCGADADRLAAAFGMTRLDGKPGLSCAIPYPSAQFDFDSIVVGAVAFQYYQIATRAIEIEIIDEISGRRQNLDIDGLLEFFNSAAFEALKAGVLKRTASALDYAKSSFEFVRTMNVGSPAAHIAIGEKPVGSAEMRKIVATGKTLHVSRDLRADHERNGEIKGRINVFARKASGSDVGANIRVRDGIVVTGKPIMRGMITLTVAENDDIADLIGDGENPSHTDWSSSQARKRGWTVSAAPVFAAFNHTASEVLSSLSGHEEESDRFSLAGFFPVSGTESTGVSDIGAPDEETEEEGRPINEGNGPSDILAFSCDHKRSVMEITLTKAAKSVISESGPLHLEIVAEYDKSPKNANALVDANGFFNVLRGAAMHTVETTPKGQRLSLPQAMPDLKVSIKIDMIRDVRVRCALIDPANDESVEEAA